MAHEIGHNLANGHDSGSCALANKKHVMQLGWSLYNWSQCARRNFIMLYLQLKRADNWCLDGKFRKNYKSGPYQLSNLRASKSKSLSF